MSEKRVTREEMFAVVKSNIQEIVEGTKGLDIKETDSMRDYGADSLEIVEVVSRSMKELRIKVPRTELSGAKSLKELLRAARANPGQLNFSSAGVGSGTHFAAETFKSMAAIDVVHVPNKGIPEALTEALTGRVQFFMAPIANSVGAVRDGRLAGLGVSSLKRDALLPDVPTVDEAGVAGYESELWFGILAPAGLPPAVMAKLNRQISGVLAAAETRARWSAIGIEPRPTQPAEFDDLVRREVALFGRIARAAQIRAD